MNTEIENELRAALHHEATRVPAAASARLQAHDYHPRSRRVRRPALLALLAGAAGGTGVLVSLIGGASPAFAGWTPHPTAASPAQLAAASAQCTARGPFAGLPLVLTDTRGPFTFEVYASDTRSSVCITSSSFTQVSSAISAEPDPAPAGELQLSGDHVQSQDGSAYSFATGKAGAGVSAVTLNLDGGSQVQATVASGWFVAWWPGEREVSSAAVTTAGGTHTQTVRQPGSPCDPKLCTGSASGGTVTGGSGTATGPTVTSGTVNDG